MIGSCTILGVEHEFEWQVAAFGSQIFKCKNCPEVVDVIEDCQT